MLIYIDVMLSYYTPPEAPAYTIYSTASRYALSLDRTQRDRAYISILLLTCLSRLVVTAL
jgi:hypothetical protein